MPIQLHTINHHHAHPLVIKGKIAGRQTNLLIDSGASLTLINEHFFLHLPYNYQRKARYPPPSLFLQLADRSRLYIKYMLALPITINDSTRIHTVYVVPQLWRPCIIGNDLIRKHNLQINGGKQQAYFQEKERNQSQVKQELHHLTNQHQYTLLSNELIKIPPFHAFDVAVRPNKPFPTNHEEENIEEEYELTSITSTPRVANGIITPRESITIQTANLTDTQIIIHRGQALATMTRLNPMQVNAIHHSFSTMNPTSISLKEDSPALTESILNEPQKEEIQKLIQSFPTVFNPIAGRTTKLRHQINLIPGSRPCNSAPFRYAPARRQIIEENLQEMTAQGIIKPSKSPWASPVVLAPKKDGTLRFCIDYRKVNAMTVRDAYPIPRIDDTLDSLQEAKFVSTLDLRSGYWQVEMDNRSQDKTAFVTHKGLFEFNVMPYGLTNAPATFQRLMDIVLAGLKWQCCLVYIDDVVIYSPTFEQHLTDLTNVFEALKSANLTLKASKCHFCRREMQYLGHLITQDGVKPDPALIKSVSNFPQPRKIKDVQSFLGLTGYYRRFIKNYAKIAEPLLKQLRVSQKGNHRLEWSNECTHAFQSLKEKLTNAPIMNTPNFNEPFILELDACEYGLGAILTQEYDHNKYVIAYASRTLCAAERNYGATEREALAIVWATKHFRPYLEGNKIYIRSDCKALQWMRTAKDVTGRIARWAIKLSAYQIEEIQYRPGKSNANADSLSRNPLPEENSTNCELATVETGINLWENTNILDQLRHEQQKDSKLKPIIDCLSVRPPIEFNDKRSPYALINGLLYKIKNSNRNYNQRILGNKHLLVIPKAIQPKLLEWAHDHPTAGHGGQQRTLFRLSSRVFWESMRKDIYHYVAACAACQQFKYINAPTSNPMQLHTVTEPWHTIGIDLMGPFPNTFHNKRFLFVVVDYFTRWIEVFSMRTTTSHDIAEILTNQVFTRYGMPKFILSDNGPQFVSNLFNSFCQAIGIQQKFTANYHPQSNMTERVNRTLKPLIAIYAQRQPHSWDREIQKVAFAIRTSVNETTGETPAFLMFGRDIKGPLDIILAEPIQGPPPTTLEQQQIHEYKRRLLNNLRCAYNAVNEHADVQKQNQKTKYDQHTTQRNFKEGDLVWSAIPTNQIGGNTISTKLQANYQGPCKITKQLTPSTFIVRRLHDDVDLGATNIDRLKLYVEPLSMNSDQPENNPEMIRDNTHQQPPGDAPITTAASHDPALNTDEQPDTRTDDAPARQLPCRQRKLPARYAD